MFTELPKTQHDLENSTYCDVTFQVIRINVFMFEEVISFFLTRVQALARSKAILSFYF